MTDRHRHEDDPRCLAFVCENASRGQTVLAGTAIARAADAMCRARGVPPNAPRLELVARVAALRATDLPAALAAEGVPAPRARALAPHVERMLDCDAFNALDRDRWVSITSAHGVPAAEHACLLLLGTLAIEAAHELATPPPIPNAIVHIEPRERSPEGPWPGVLAAGTHLFAMDEPEVRAFLADVRDRLVAHCPGVRDWLPASDPTKSTITVRVPAGHPGLPLTFAPFVVCDPETLAELDSAGLPDAALPGPVYRLPI